MPALFERSTGGCKKTIAVKSWSSWSCGKSAPSLNKVIAAALGAQECALVTRSQWSGHTPTSSTDPINEREGLAHVLVRLLHSCC